MNMRPSIFSALLLLFIAGIPSLAASESDIKSVLHDARGAPVTDSNNHCVLTEWDTPSDECGAPAPHDRLASVYFDFNKATLTGKSRVVLDSLLATLKDKHIEAVTIAGYADAIGSDSYNKRLSEKRARAVQHYLRAHGFHHSNTDVRALGNADARTTGECKGLKAAKLHACMQADRRVDIELSVLAK